MKVLNLVYPDKSDIKYKVQKFPDGQQNIVIELFDIYYEDAFLPKPIQINSRLNNWLDLELIVCAVASLREVGTEEIHLYTPYIIGARSDRKFEEGGNNYIKDVIAPVINSLNFKSVTCIDPHSDVLEACIKGFRKESNLNLVIYSLQDLYFDIPNKLCSQKVNEDVILVSPDAGASKKIYKLAEKIGYKGDIITCSKDRDNDGNLTWVNVPIKEKDLNKDIIIIDDICDGGATFNNISAALTGSDHQGKKYLIVTHGIFSKGFDTLSKYFDGIYCTNSYKDLVNTLQLKQFVKQLNVF